MAEIVCLGAIVADVLAQPIESFPPRGKLILVDRVRLDIGGCAANTAIGLARLGFNTAMMGKLGADAFGDAVMSFAQQEGVDTSGIIRDPVCPTAATMVLIHPDGERSFIHAFGTNASLEAADVDFELIRQARLFHFAGSLVLPKIDGAPTARLLSKARDSGVITALDTIWDAQGRWMSVLAPCLPFVDYFLPSLEEAKMLTGQTEPEAVASALAEAGVGTVVLKMAERGCYVRANDGAFRVPAYRIDCLDATGAGDAFAAGFLAGVVKGWDLEASARFGNAVGAMACLSVGATAGVRSCAETLEFQRTTEVRD